MRRKMFHCNTPLVCEFTHGPCVTGSASKRQFPLLINEGRGHAVDALINLNK
jgi:hypothetical protein